MPLAVIVNDTLLRPQYMASASPHLLGIDPKMYRHFAVLSIGLSIIIAVFADGETQDAMAQNEQRAQIKRADEDKFGKAKLADHRTGSPRHSSQGGFNGNYGAPMDGSAGSGGNSSYVPPNLALTNSTIIIEVDQAALARMSPEQRKAYLKRLEDERQRRLQEGPVVPSPQQISALAAASAARSGSESID